MIYVFHLLSGLTLFGAIMVVISRKPVHSILYLILSFFAIAAHFALLNAQFLAVVQIIVYAGAIMVLFLFVVMLLYRHEDSDTPLPAVRRLTGIIAGGLLLLVLVVIFKKVQDHALAPEAVSTSEAGYTMGMVKQLGNILFTQYLLPFEVISILFLTAMIGAVLLGKKE